MATYDDIMAAITNEATSAKTTDAFYKEAKEGFAAIEKAYFNLRGFKFDGAKGFVQQLLPMLMRRAGIPGGLGMGALGASLLADEGAFSGLMENIPFVGRLISGLGNATGHGYWGPMTPAGVKGMAPAYPARPPGALKGGRTIP